MLVPLNFNLRPATHWTILSCVSRTEAPSTSNARRDQVWRRGRTPISTQELRRAWRRLYHTGPPLGLSRDLIIRELADKRQQRAHGGPSHALQRRLRILAGEFEKGAGSFDAGGVLKTGASLVRRWRGHTYTVLVGEDGFEYDGQRYRSLTVIAERITGAHWSGPRFFGVNKRARAS
jgi:hypothetical protein